MSINTELELRLQFFDYLFEDRSGFLSVAYSPKKNKNEFKERWFNWPEQREGMGAFIEEIKQNNNVWFSVNQFKRPKRAREYALPTNLVWADLDYCNPAQITPAPQCRIESSPHKYQAFWRLDEQIPPEDAQTLSKRIAYAYADEGVDKSGWDIEQLLRVPFTFNYKYDNGAVSVPEVKILAAFEARLPVALFEEVTVVTPEEQLEGVEPMPDIMALPDVNNIIYAKRHELRKTSFATTFGEEPTEDWSGVMWHLLMICFEVGMDKEEAFAIALAAKCNKYARDNRPISYLWREVLKADLKAKQIAQIFDDPKPLLIPLLFDGTEPPDNIVEGYKEWAVEATDAVPEYHELACCILLSTLMASGLFVETSFGKVVPNLWGLVLGDSTLTRKTTAMKMAMQFVGDIDREVLISTGGSVEGLLTSLAGRPNKVSVFHRDEVAGLIDEMNNKSYLSGMAETLTRLYDVPEFHTHTLRKENIVITSPVFIFFGGGIRDKMYSLLTEQHVLGGFLPRFLVVGGDADFNKIRPVEALAPQLGETRRSLLNVFTDLHTAYNEDTELAVPEAGTVLKIPRTTEVTFDSKAWKYFQDIQMLMAKEAHESSFSLIAQPTFDRMAWSCLKMGMLLAAARQKPKNDKISVKLSDMQAAAFYVQKWGTHMIDLIQNVGKSTPERMVMRVLAHIKRRPGCTRSEISAHHHLQKRELDMVLDTLEDRGQIRKEKIGNGYRIYPIG